MEARDTLDSSSKTSSVLNNGFSPIERENYDRIGLAEEGYI